jgi:rhodanese-related sulfurtransferase
MRKAVVTIAVVALVMGVGSIAAAQENPAAWDAAAKYMETLPQGFNGIAGDALKAKLDSGEKVFLLDVREPNEFATGRIEGSVNVPVRQVSKSLDKIPQDKNAQIVVVCAGAVRSGYVVQALSYKGYTNVKHLARGFGAAWASAGYPVQK